MMRLIVFAVLALGFWTTAAAVPTELALNPSPTIVYGVGIGKIGTLRFAYDCSRFPLPFPRGSITTYFDGANPGAPEIYPFDGRCEVGIYTQEFYFASNLRRDSVSMGSHTISAKFHGFAELEPSVSAPAAFTFVPQYTGTPLGGRGTVGVSVLSAGDNQSGSGRTITIETTPRPPSPAQPPGLNFAYGFVNVEIAKHLQCGTLCPGNLGELHAEARLVLLMPELIPSGATVWAYTRHAADPVPQWRQLAATIEGDHIRVNVRGGLLSSASGKPLDPVIRGSVAVALPRGIAAPLNVQDAWWGGASEDGWGVSVAQRDDRLFVSLSVYDGAGLPMWLLMPEGRWDAAHGIFSGALYRPPSADRLGAAAGSATLTMIDGDTATLAYSVYGSGGTKTIRRFAFDAPSGQTAPQAGVWDLIGAGTGGLTINRRGDQLFATWLKFAASGPGEWLVMPGGTWASADTFEGTIYRTSGSAWVGVTYDRSQFRAVEIGRMRLRFTGDHSAEMSYTVDGVPGMALLERHWF